MLFLWIFAIVAFRHALGFNAEIGAFQALYFFKVYDFDAEVRGASQNRVASGAHDGDKAYTIEHFLKYIAPTRKVLERDDDGKKIPGKYIDLPRWDKVDWDLIEKNPDDLEKIAYELVHSNFTTGYVQTDKVEAANQLGDEKTLTNQLALVATHAKETFGEKLSEVAKKKFESVKTTMQAVGDVHRKAAADGLRKTFGEYKEFKDFKIYTRTTDKAPVRGFQEIDMEKTLKENGNPRRMMDQLRDFRMSGANGGADEAFKRIERQMNNIDNLQRNTQRLTPRPKRACTI